MKNLLVVFFCLTLQCLSAQTAFFQALDRAGQSLNGDDWHIIIDPYKNGFYDYRYTPFDETDPIVGGYSLDAKAQHKSDLIEYNYDTAPTLTVPGDWNSQDEQLLYYEGAVWYRKKFDVPAASRHGKRHFIYFSAANYQAHVYLNGRKLGTHVGGFTPFHFEVTGQLKETDNSLVVMVDNTRHLEAVPTVNTDWWNYGGITRDVKLIEVPETYIDRFTVIPQNDGSSATISVSLDGPDCAQQTIRLVLDESGQELSMQSDGHGRAETLLDTSKLAKWSPDNPQLYTLTIISDQDKLTDKIGFRTIETQGADILLNGKSIFLRGISIHEESPLRQGRALSESDAEYLLGQAKELGCNFVRLAHYPHNEYMARKADEMGILVWEEIPVYWTIDWENPDTLHNARDQLKALVTRDINRSSVIIWSMANETPISEARTHFLKALVEDTRKQDPTRLISAAMELHEEADKPGTIIVNDPFGQYTDLISFNEYIGWYNGLPEKCDRITWDIAYDKPVIISEFGAGAKFGFTGDSETRFSEAFQADLYRHTLPMLQRIPNWRGATPWILFDFRSPRRMLPDIQDGYNRKGLISERGEKKAAYKVLQQFYEKAAIKNNDSTE